MNIVEAVKSCGVVGAGGAGFPTHIKLTSKVKTYIANGAECEPLLKIDQQLMSSYADKIIHGLEYAMESTGAETGIIATKQKYKQAVDALTSEIKKSKKNLKINFLSDYYPAGDEFMVTYETTAQIIPESGLPLDVDCVVNNVHTLMNIFDAVEYNKPVTERPLTITGAVKNPLSIFIPIGTPIKTALELAGGVIVKDYIILDGGPMMGKLVSEEDVVMKTTSGIVVFPIDHEISRLKKSSLSFILRHMKSACEQCQDCTQICPRYLLGHLIQPHKIQRSVAGGKIENITEAFLCSECGLCEWVCPQRLLPRRINQEIKKQMISQGLKNPHKNKPTKTHDMRETRKVLMDRILSRFDLINYDYPATLIKEIPRIDEVKIPLLQHTGVPAEPVVKINDIVKKGDLIAKIPDGKVSANIHASIDGKITYVDSNTIVIKR